MTMAGSHGVGSSNLAGLVSEGINVGMGGLQAAGNISDELLAKKWLFFQWDLAHSGRGLDEQYRIVDREGTVLET